VSRRFLIVYATSYGQTAKIARRMADLLIASGEAVTLVNAGNHPHDFHAGEFDGVIIGGSIIGERHQRALTHFVRGHRPLLNALPSAFFSVSGSAASRLETERAKARQFVAEFLDRTGWHPALTETIGGSMAYTKYNPFLRWVVKRAAKAAGGPTDTSRDHEVTDWPQVERFVHAFVQTVPLPSSTGAALVAT
jgi:menaquinone-dependent protoporphyrinogen oxidase